MTYLFTAQTKDQVPAGIGFFRAIIIWPAYIGGLMAA